MSGWAEVRPGFWKRDVPGGFLGVKRAGARWMWVHMVDGYQFASTQCFGFETASAAMVSADGHPQVSVDNAASRGKVRRR